MATVTVGTIGGTMTKTQLKTALDAALGVDLTRQGATTSTTYRCVDNLVLQGNIDAEGFTFICANLKTVTFNGSAASPAVLSTSTYVEGVAYLPIRIIYEGETPFDEHSTTLDTQGLFRYCGADVGKMEIITGGNGTNYFGISFLTSQKVVIKDLSVSNQNTTGKAYTNFNLTHSQSYIRVSLLRGSSLRLSTSTLDFGFTGVDGYAIGETGNGNIKILCPHNTRIVGFAGKFLDATNQLQLTDSNFAATTRIFKDSFIDPGRIRMFPSNNDNTVAELERTAIYKPVTSAGTSLSMVSIRVKSSRTITGNAGVSAGDTILATSTINTNDTQVHRVWRGWNPSTGTYTLSSKIIDDSNLSITYRRADLQEVEVLATGYQDKINAQGQMITDSNFTGTVVEASNITGIAFAYNIATNTVSVTATEPKTLQDVYNYWKYWSSLTDQMGLVLVPQDLIKVVGTTLKITGSLLTTANVSNTTKIANIECTNDVVANGAISNLSIIGNVLQATPTNLSNVTISGTLTYNTNTATSITISNNTAIGTVANSGTGIVTISRDNTSSITTYTDAEINFVDSNLSAVGITSATIYGSQSDRDTGANAGATFTTSLDFKYGSVVSGVTMQNTVYLRVVVGSVTLFAPITLVTGSNVLDLGVQGQLSAINAKVDLTAKETTLLQTGTDIIAEINANETKIDTLQTSVDNLPTLSEIEASTELAKESSVQLAIAVSV